MQALAGAPIAMQERQHGLSEHKILLLRYFVEREVKKEESDMKNRKKNRLRKDASMNLRFWRPVVRRRVASPRLTIIGGLLSLTLIAGVLIASVVFTRPAAAASKQSHVAPTNGTPRLEVLTTHAGYVYHQWSDDNGATWSGLENLGKPQEVDSADLPADYTPAAISDGTGHLNIFAENQRRVIWQRTIVNGGQGLNWFEVPGQEGDGTIGINCSVLNVNCFYEVTSAPAVASWGPGRMDLFAYAFNDNGTALLHTWADNYQWSGTWEVLGTGSMYGSPAAVSWGPGRIDVFARVGGNGLDHKWFDNGQWSDGLLLLGAPISSNPSVASSGSGLLNVYVSASNGDLWTIGYAGGWGSSSDRGGTLSGDASSVAAVSPGLLTVDVFVIGTQHALYGGVYNLTTGWAPSHFINQSVSYTNIAAAEWFPVAPPPPPPPSPTPGISPTPCIHQPCISTP